MGQQSAEAVIAMPRQEVWARLRDLLVARNYVPGVTALEFNSAQHEGVGASRKVFMKGRAPVDETAIAWEDGRGITMKVHDGDKPAAPFKWATLQYEIEDAPGGQTRVRMTFSYEVQWGILGRVLDLIVLRPAIRRTNAQLGPNMKKFYETGEVTNPAAARAGAPSPHPQAR